MRQFARMSLGPAVQSARALYNIYARCPSDTAHISRLLMQRDNRFKHTETDTGAVFHNITSQFSEMQEPLENTTIHTHSFIQRGLKGYSCLSPPTHAHTHAHTHTHTHTHTPSCSLTQLTHSMLTNTHNTLSAHCLTHSLFTCVRPPETTAHVSIRPCSGNEGSISSPTPLSPSSPLPPPKKSRYLIKNLPPTSPQNRDA